MVASEFHEIDFLFARRLSQEPQCQFLLAKLLRATREGELSLSLTEEEKEYAQKKLDVLPGIVLQGNRLYLQRHFALKSRFYGDLARLRESFPKKEVGYPNFSGLREKQKEALLACKEHSFWIITGGPGTGKTHLLSRLVQEFSPYLSIVVTAPTGKASVRIRELLPEGTYSTMTLHKLLQIGKKKQIGFLPYDLILVDESSMVDVTLFTKLLASIKTGSRLILVGDHEQLPPVEGASYFRELVQEGTEYTTFLEGSMRAENSELLELAHKVRVGESFPTGSLLRAEELVESVEDKVLFREGDGFTRMTRFKILTPFRAGHYGTLSLNHRFYERQKLLYPKAPIPIMVTVNDDKWGIYNGDMALMQGDKVLFADGQVLSLYYLRGYELAYVVSVHKSQGSEYEEVLLLLPPGSDRFGKELLYTAVTRAKRQVRILTPSQHNLSTLT